MWNKLLKNLLVLQHICPLGRKGRRVGKRSRTTPSASVTALVRKKYNLKWLIECKAYQCYGCNSAICVPGHVCTPPEDFVAATTEYRSFMKNGKLQVHYGKTHYLLRKKCVKEKNAEFSPLMDLVLTPTMLVLCFHTRNYCKGLELPLEANFCTWNESEYVVIFFISVHTL